MLRNAEVDPDAIAEGGFEATARRAQSCEPLLAVEDSTSLAYRHSVAKVLGTTSSNPTSVIKGFIVHSVVLLDGCTGGTVGLIEQRRWTRVADDYGKSNDRKRRAYQDKESFKWQQAGQAVRERLGEALSQRAIAICDREAIVAVCQAPRFASLPPSQIVPRLADEGCYLGSESSFYRVLHEAGQQHHRGRADLPRRREPATHEATGPNQLWCWDVSYLPSGIRGMYYYLYPSWTSTVARSWAGKWRLRSPANMARRWCNGRRCAKGLLVSASRWCCMPTMAHR